MAKGEKKYHAHLDDFFKGLEQEPSKGLDESFKAVDEFTKEENRLYLLNNVFNPAQDDLYNAIRTELEKTFEKDGKHSAKLYKKEKEVKKAVAAGLKKYFAKAHPSLITKMGGMDEEEQYGFLAHHYDEHIGADPAKGEGIRALVTKHIASKKATAGHLIHGIYEKKAEHSRDAVDHLTERYFSHHLGKYHPTDIAEYIKPHVEKRFDIEDKARFGTLNTGELNMLRSIVSREEYPKEFNPAQFGLKKKEEKKKK